MTTAITFEQNNTEASEGAIELIAGATRTFACTYVWGNPTSPSATAFRSTSGTGSGRSVTSTIFPTNSPSASGSVVTLSPATGFVGDAEYIITVSATVDSQTTKNQIRVIVKKDGRF